MRRNTTIVTTNEFVYDVLNNMVHNNEIVLSQKDVANSKSLKNILTRFNDTFIVEEGGEFLILRKVKQFDANIKYQRIKHY
jgi:predicted nucleic-acid-binding protein